MPALLPAARTTAAAAAAAAASIWFKRGALGGRGKMEGKQRRANTSLRRGVAAAADADAAAGSGGPARAVERRTNAVSPALKTRATCEGFLPPRRPGGGGGGKTDAAPPPPPPPPRNGKARRLPLFAAQVN